MAEPTERIEVRRIYPSTAARFGVMFALIVALISGVFVLISGTFVPGGIILGTWQVNTMFGILTFAGVTAVSMFVLVFASIFVGSLIYNWLSRMGLRVHIGLAEYEEKEEKNHY